MFFPVKNVKHLKLKMPQSKWKHDSMEYVLGVGEDALFEVRSKYPSMKLTAKVKAPENGWLEYFLVSFGDGYFQGEVWWLNQGWFTHPPLSYC